MRTREQYETEEGRHIIIIIFTPTIREAFAPSVTASDGLSPFLIGRMFLREPSWKYSAKLVGS